MGFIGQVGSRTWSTYMQVHRAEHCNLIATEVVILVSSRAGPLEGRGRAFRTVATVSKDSVLIALRAPAWPGVSIR